MASRWTHAVCTECFHDRHPRTAPKPAKEDYRKDEQCCYCGIVTRSGLYDRHDPQLTPCLGRNNPVHQTPRPTGSLEELK